MDIKYEPPEWLKGINPTSSESIRKFVEENFRRTTESGFWWEKDDEKAKAISDKIHDDMMKELNEYLQWWRNNS